MATAGRADRAPGRPAPCGRGRVGIIVSDIRSRFAAGLWGWVWRPSRYRNAAKFSTALDTAQTQAWAAHKRRQLTNSGGSGVRPACRSVKGTRREVFLAGMKRGLPLPNLYRDAAPTVMLMESYARRTGTTQGLLRRRGPGNRHRRGGAREIRPARLCPARNRP